MKSFNLSLKVECKQCDLAKGRKRARIEKEDAENIEETDVRDNTEDEDEDNLEESISDESRKKKGLMKITLITTVPISPSLMSLQSS